MGIVSVAPKIDRMRCLPKGHEADSARKEWPGVYGVSLADLGLNGRGEDLLILACLTDDVSTSLTGDSERKSALASIFVSLVIIFGLSEK